MNDENKNVKYFLIACGMDIITKIISLILFIKRFSDISKEIKDKSILSFPYLDNIQKQTNEKKSWSKTSIFKFSINIFLTILSIILCVPRYIKYLKNSQVSECFLWDNCLMHMIICISYFFFEGMIWLLSSILLYKETNYYRNQSWNGLRFFWFTNGLFNFIKIFTIIYLIITEKNKNFYGNYIICFHCFLSIILFYYSIFRPYDITYKSIENLLKDDIINNELNSISNDNSIDNSVIEYTETFDYDENFNLKDDVLYSITIKNGNLNNNIPLKKKLFLKIKTNDFKSINFSLILTNKTYKKEKSPSEISIFLKKLIKIYKNKKYENNIINLLQQSYNISLTLNPERNSYTGKKESINTLTHLFNEVIKLSNNFLLDLLLFLDLSNISLVQTLRDNNIESVSEELNNDIESEDEDESNVENIINNMSKRKTFKSSLSKYENTSIMGDKKIFINNMNQMSRDMIKLYNFFNSILTKENCISIKIIKVNDEKNNIECLLKTNNPVKEAIINIDSENLLDIIYDDQLKTYYIDHFNSMIENNDFSIFDLLLRDYLNNLIYYDEILFNQFQLNKILNLDIEKFNEDILINFFENENIECPNMISNILFDIILQPFDGDVLIDNKILSIKCQLKGVDKTNIIDGNNKEAIIDLNLIAFYKVIDNVLPIINIYLKKNLSELYSSLNEIKTYIENYLEVIFNINQEDIKKMNSKVEGEIQRIKYKKLLFGQKKIDEFASLFESKLLDNFIDNNLEKDNLGKINEIIKEIGKGINSILNNKNLKYGLFFFDIRKILGIAKLFN